MKIDKEYPATHSMSTAWYIVDDEGNVGIMDYNENGPVPYGISEHGVTDLVWGLCDDLKYSEIPCKLTKDQIYDNLSKPHSPKDESLWFDCIVKIRTDKTERFKEICKLEGVDECVCISEEEGLYIFDAYESTDFDNEYDVRIKSGSPLKTLLDENIIVQVYRQIDFTNNDTYNNSKAVPSHSKNYDNCSFFIYHQPYWENFLPEKVSTPKHPVKFSQLPDEIKSKVHHIPGDFNKLKTFQIAEYYPSDTTHCIADPLVMIEGCEYKLLPLSDGTKAYLLSDNSDGHNIKYTIEEFELLKKQGKASVVKR